MKKLTNKAKAFLEKYQLGGMPYINPAEDFDWEIWNSANNQGDAAQVPFLSPNQLNSDSKSFQPSAQTAQDNSSNDFLNAIPAIGKLALGISSIIGAGKQRREAKRMQKEFEADTKRRMEEGRTNNFYATPYTTGRYSNFGKSYSAFQQGGLSDQIDLFSQMYNQSEMAKQNTNQSIQDFYSQLLTSKKNKAKQMQAEGFQNIGSGAMDALKMFLQQGGNVPLTKEEKRNSDHLFKRITPDTTKTVLVASTSKPTFNPNSTKLNSSKTKSRDRFREHQDGGLMEGSEDLYSENFMSPFEEEQAPTSTGFENEIQNWIFEDEELPKDYSVNDYYFSQNQANRPIQSVVDQLTLLGLKPSSIDSGTHNVGSKHYEGKAVDLGLNTTFGGDKNKMDEFYQFLNSPEGKKRFPNVKVRDERNKPKDQQVWSGSHLHLEIN